MLLPLSTFFYYGNLCVSHCFIHQELCYTSKIDIEVHISVNRMCSFWRFNWLKKRNGPGRDYTQKLYPWSAMEPDAQLLDETYDCGFN